MAFVYGLVVVVGAGRRRQIWRSSSPWTRIRWLISPSAWRLPDKGKKGKEMAAVRVLMDLESANQGKATLERNCGSCG